MFLGKKYLSRNFIFPHSTLSIILCKLKSHERDEKNLLFAPLVLILLPSNHLLFILKDLKTTGTNLMKLKKLLKQTMYLLEHLKSMELIILILFIQLLSLWQKNPARSGWENEYSVYKRRYPVDQIKCRKITFSKNDPLFKMVKQSLLSFSTLWQEALSMNSFQNFVLFYF